MWNQTVFAVFGYALLTALATGLGALPLAVFRNPSRRWLGIANGLAAGLMLSAGVALVIEAQAYSSLRTLIGVGLGLVIIVVSRWLLGDDDEGVILGEMQGADALKVLLIMGIMTVHSFTEGVGVGVSFGGGESLGLFITAAIAVHNIPEGLAISLVMVPRGSSVRKAAWWSVLSSLPQPLMAVPAFLFVETFRPFLPIGLGFAAGAMFWMIGSELLPDALEDAPRRDVVFSTVLSGAAMALFQLLLK